MSASQKRSEAPSTGESKEPTLAGDSQSTKTPIRRFDFGFVPILSHLRHDPERPFHFGLSLNLFFGLASTLTVGNLYFCQPILVRLAESFRVSNKDVTIIPTLTQSGYAVGLLLISPLGDLVRRRQLLLLLGCLIGVFTLGLALSPTNKVFAGLSFLMGIFTVVPQIMIPLAADLAPPERRASAISIVFSGLLLGVLFARVLSGIIAEFTNWRVIYWISTGLQFANVFAMWLFVPDYAPKTLAYRISALGGSLEIGLFGLVGAAGVVTTPFIGRFVDKLNGWTATLIAILLGIAFQAIFTGAAGIHLAPIIIVCFGLDVAIQMNQVSNSSRIYAIEPLARARMNAVLVICLFLGQVMGTSVGTQVYLKYGWRYSGVLALGFQGLMIVLLLLRGPHAPRKLWFGWSGEKKAPTEDEKA
ncbi:major facilitator superfamily transporter [Ceratobasidium sp. AG-Ba]|nr:major facilitator superfamily transporter [Ceratobasidium sp. AG-Ba]